MGIDAGGIEIERMAAIPPPSSAQKRSMREVSSGSLVRVNSMMVSELLRMLSTLRVRLGSLKVAP